MPSKRSKSKEREKQRKRRQNLTEEMKETVREKDRVRKKIAKSNLPEEEFEVQKSKISDEDKEFNKIKKKHRMREMRNSRSGKDHLTENLQAKKGMALLESEGRKKDFARRTGGKLSEIDDFERYHKSGKRFENKLLGERPDIVMLLNEKAREEKEKERNRKEMIKNEGGEWIQNGEYGDYYWSGDGEPNWENDSFEDEQLTAKQIEEFKRQESEEDLEMKRIRKFEEREKQRIKQEERKERMKTPLDPLPENELSDYEKLRDRNIKEREQAMIDSGFFEDLNAFKKEIGLTKETIPIIEGHRK